MKELFERARAACGVSQYEFIRLFNLGVSALASRFGDRFLTDNGKPPAAVTAKDTALPVLPEYREALLDFVRYGVTGEEQRQVEFLAKADMAYRKVWRTAEKGLKRKKGVW